MNVLVITNMYPYDGSGYYGVFVREHVDAIRQDGVEVDVFFSNPRLSRARYFLDLPPLVRRLRGTRYDVLHAQHTYCVFQALLARRAIRPRTPLVFTIHEAEAQVASKREDIGADALKRLVYSKRLKRLALELSDSVVAVGSELPKTVGFDGPYEVIAPAVDPEYFRPANRIGARVQLGLPFDEHLLLFPADPSLFQKGADVFHKSMSHLHVPVRTIYGGSIPRDQMPLYMNAADVVVQTSRFEASPMVVKEAFACDTPVVSTDVGDVAQLFGDLPGCFITASEPAAVADAIQRGLEFDGGTGGPERIRELRLTPHAVANRYHRLFTTLARSAGDCRLTDR